MSIKSLFKSKKNFSGAQPTVFHVTHYKSGSQWVLAVLNELAKDRVVPPQVGANHVTKDSHIPGHIYPCVYLSKAEFLAAGPPDNRKVFIVIRDLRDTLVSLYFSVKNSHEMLSTRQQELRDALKSKDFTEGMILLMEKRLFVSAIIQKTWVDSGDLLIRYEDLIKDEQDGFKKIVSHCEISVKDAAIRNAVDLHSFEKKAGRKPGEEDANSHHRKGISGDWQNHFDQKLTRIFKQQYGDVLIATGYETDTNW